MSVANSYGREYTNQSIQQGPGTSTKQTLAEQLPLLESALAKLNDIVENHPSSDLAVKLITGQQIGDISLAGVADAIAALSRLQNQEAVRSTCLESLDAANPECREWLHDIARAQLQADDLEAALETAKLIVDVSTQQRLLRDIAKERNARVYRYLRAGNLKGALAAAKSIEDARARDRAFNAITQTQVEIVDDQLQAGNLEDALTTAKSIQSGDVRAQKLHVIARTQVEMVDTQLQAGNLEGALATAKSIEYIVIRDQAFHDIAEVQAQAGNFHDALAAAKSIESDHLRAQILDTIEQQAK